MEATDSTPENGDKHEVVNPGELLGQKLKQGREKVNYSIERVAMATKISLPFVIALESNDLSKLPEEVFARGFIRNLAKLYDLNEKELLLLFNEAIENDESKGSDDGGSEYRNSLKLRRSGYNKSKRRNSSSKQGIFKPASIIVLLVGLAIGIGLVVWDRYNKPVKVFSKNKVSQAPVKNLELKNKIVKGESIPSEAIVSNSKSKVPSEAQFTGVSEQGDGTQVVLVKVLNNVRLRIAKDNGTAVTENLSPDSYKYRFQDELRMFIYDSSAVEISYNGKSIGNIGGSGEYSRLAFKAAKLEKSKESQ